MNRVIATISICIVAAIATAGETNDLTALTRDFYSQISSLDAKKKDARAQLAQDIKKASSDKAPENWLKTLLGKRKECLGRLDAGIKGPAVAAYAATLLPELDARRKAAVDYILSDKYDKPTQETADGLVGKVRELWDNPYSVALPKNEPLQKLLDNLKELDGYLALYPDASVPGAFEEKTATEAFNHAFWDALIKPDWRAIDKFNDELAWLDPEEKAHLRILNAYRMMLGRNPLEADIRLLVAARGHCQDMIDKKFFAHDSPVPGKGTPEIRCNLVGYKSYAGENIYMGSTQGSAAFEAWYHSPGHHKNMIRTSKQIGAGRVDKHWCQDFGGEGPFGAKGAKTALIQYYEKDFLLPATAGVKERLELAQFALQSKLWPQAKEQLNHVLTAEPDNAMAKRMAPSVDAELEKLAKQPKKK